ncbi:hypothetical protein GCM10027275_10390 [Rhabdobacter roseus]|uniref:Antitoxin component YwqK of YwqJK toxin-antitoxin module n=1 Tax=Rhabdobacter roseus TaxID=1655419 RepID=A0A840TMG2_9BACT|nr:hypothetical protein [Rhabdobacter roseus]MBB5282947.1 antitoxin component YwqK of YwqJK toxin-antitoxin module [Rhabdobacter roseus]
MARGNYLCLIYLIFTNLIFLNCGSNIRGQENVLAFDTLSDGRLLISGMLINGKKNGVWNSYYDNGQFQFVETYINDTLNGPWISYRDNGNIFTLGEFKNNLEEGEWLHFGEYPNHIAVKRYYSNGKKIGTWEYYDHHGRLELKIKYGKNEVEEILVDNRMPVPDQQ